MGLEIQTVSVFSSKGSRSAQEDHVLVNKKKSAFMVADGFGGPVAGALTAKNACEFIRGFLEKEAGDLEATLPFVLRGYYSLAGNVLFNALIHANREILRLNSGQHIHEKGGASVIAGFMDNGILALANVGACSAWLFRNGKIIELVLPRTYSRLLYPEQVDSVSLFDSPLMAMGMTSDLEPEIVEYRIQSGDWVLLQTDGLRAESRQGILEIFGRNASPEEAAHEITALLQNGRYDDNVAASVVIF